MTKEQTKTEQTAKQRATEILEQRGGRRPMDGLVSKFAQIPTREGFKTHWFNDEDGKIERALQNGWIFAERKGYTDNIVDLVKNPRKRIGVRVDTKKNLEDLFAYAMDIPQTIYDMDRRAKLEVVDRKEEYMKTGKVDAGGLKAVDVQADIKTNQKNFQPD